MIKLVIISVIFIVFLIITVGFLLIAVKIAYDPPEIHDGCPCLDLAWPRECYRKESEGLVMSSLDELSTWWDNENARKIVKIEKRAAEIRKQRNRERLNSQLKPCPFCGGKAEIRNNTEFVGGCNYETVSVRCGGCGCSTIAKIGDRYYERYCRDEEIAEMWNRRVGE